MSDATRQHTDVEAGSPGRPATVAQSGHHPLISRLMLTVMLAVVVGLAIVLLGSSHGLSAALRAFRPAYLAPVLVLSLVNYGVRYMRWELYLRRCGVVVGARASSAIFASGLAMSITPGKFGELFKAAMLKDEANVPLSLSVPVIVSERMTDLVAIVLLVAIGAARYPVARPAVLIVAALALTALVALARSPAVMLRAKRLFTHGWLRKLRMPQTDDAAVTFALLLRGRMLFAGMGLGVLAWCAECVGLWLVLIGLGYGHLSLFAAMFVYALSTLAGAISFLPGGLGATEAGMAGLLALFAVPGGIAVAAILLIRLATLWFATLLGVVVYLWHRRALRVRCAPQASEEAHRLGAT
jgi:uncharacterized membrane protein YbhN (UPF0104 family)